MADRCGECMTNKLQQNALQTLSKNGGTLHEPDTVRCSWQDWETSPLIGALQNRALVSLSSNVAFGSAVVAPMDL